MFRPTYVENILYVILRPGVTTDLFIYIHSSAFHMHLPCSCLQNIEFIMAYLNNGIFFLDNITFATPKDRRLALLLNKLCLLKVISKTTLRSSS